MVEVLGIVAAVVVVCSMLFKTTSYKGTMTMRAINLFGSLLFIVWASFDLVGYLPSFITNCCAVILNSYYLVKEYKWHKENNHV